MKPIALKAGETFTLIGGEVKIGESGKSEDTKPIWSAVMDYCGETHRPGKVGEKAVTVAEGVDNIYPVYIAEDGSFYYDEDDILMQLGVVMFPPGVSVPI